MSTESSFTDMGDTPLSRYGANLAVAPEEGGNAVVIHNARRKWGEDVAFRVQFQSAGRNLDIAVVTSPWVMFVECGPGSARIYVRGDDVVVIEASGCDVILTQACENGYGIQEGPNRCRIISVPHRYYAAIDIFRGSFSLSGPERPAPDARIRDHRQRL